MSQIHSRPSFWKYMILKFDIYVQIFSQLTVNANKPQKDADDSRPVSPRLPPDDQARQSEIATTRWPMLQAKGGRETGPPCLGSFELRPVTARQLVEASHLISALSGRAPPVPSHDHVLWSGEGRGGRAPAPLAYCSWHACPLGLWPSMLWGQKSRRPFRPSVSAQGGTRILHQRLAASAHHRFSWLPFLPRIVIPNPDPRSIPVIIAFYSSRFSAIWLHVISYEEEPAQQRLLSCCWSRYFRHSLVSGWTFLEKIPKSSNFIGVDRIILYSTWGAELTCEAFGVMTIGLVNYTSLEAAGKSESLPHDTIYLVSDHHTEKIWVTFH